MARYNRYNSLGSGSSTLPWYEWHTAIERLNACLILYLKGKRGYTMSLKAGNWGVGFCELKRKYIQANPTWGATTPNKQFQMTKAILAHEAKHGVYTNSTIYDNDTNQYLEVLPYLVNLLEDARIEYIGSHESYDQERLFIFLQRALLKQLPTLDEIATKVGDNDSAQIVLHMIFLWRLNAPIQGAKLSVLNTQRWKVIYPWVQSTYDAPDVFAVKRIAMKILDFLQIPYELTPEFIKEMQDNLKQMMGAGERQGSRPTGDSAQKNPFSGGGVPMPGDDSGKDGGGDGSGQGSESGKDSGGGSGSGSKQPDSPELGKDGSNGGSGGDSQDSDKNHDGSTGKSSSDTKTQSDAGTEDKDEEGTGNSGNGTEKDTEEGTGSGIQKTDNEEEGKEEDLNAADAASGTPGEDTKEDGKDTDKNGTPGGVPEGWDQDTDLDPKELGLVPDLTPEEKAALEKIAEVGDGDNIDKHIPGPHQGGSGIGSALQPASYLELYEAAKPIADAIVRKMKMPKPKAIDKEDDEGRLDIGNYVRDRLMPFQNRVRKGKLPPTMAVHLVIDRSGSMNEIMHLVRLLAMAVYLACVELKIPIAITALEGIIKLVVFDKPSPHVMAYIAGLTASGGTNTQPTMEYVEETLKKRPETIRQIVFIHDGGPNDPNAFKTWKNALKGIELVGMYATDSDYSDDSIVSQLTDIFGPKSFIACPVSQMAERWSNMTKLRRLGNARKT